MNRLGRSVSDQDGILFLGEAVAGLEAERTISEDPSRTRMESYSQERRSPGWRWKEPSRTWE